MTGVARGTRDAGEAAPRVLYSPPAAWLGGRVVIEGPELHHLVHVLRCQAGDRVEIVDGEGRRCAAEIRAVAKRAAEAELVEPSEVEQPPSPAVEIVPALLRSHRMDWLVEKATELGVREISPLATERAVVRVGPDRGASQRERWERICLAAMKQSRRSWCPRVRAPRSVEEFASEWRRAPRGRLIVAWEGARESTLRGGLAVRPLRGDEAVSAVSGPEGGLAHHEVEALREAGGEVLGLGGAILRAETAALVLTAILRYEGGAL